MIAAIFIYLLVINVASYFMMKSDKQKAIKGTYRISEKNLFLVAILGGSIGSVVGMKHFRHKTKHWYFKYGMPAILIIQVIVATMLFIKFGL